MESLDEQLNSLCEEFFDSKKTEKEIDQLINNLFILIKKYPIFSEKLKKFFFEKIQKKQKIGHQKIWKYFFIGISISKTKTQIQSILNDFQKILPEIESILKDVFEVKIFELDGKFLKENKILFVYISEIIYNMNNKEKKNLKIDKFVFDNLEKISALKDLKVVLVNILKTENSWNYFIENDDFNLDYQFYDVNELLDHITFLINSTIVDDKNIIFLWEIIELLSNLEHNLFKKILFDLDCRVIFPLSKKIENANHDSLVVRKLFFFHRK